VKKSLGVLTRLTTSQTQMRSTKKSPTAAVALGRHAASASSHDCLSVRAAICGILRPFRGKTEAFPRSGST
jgi:hypothetical protein